MEEKDKIGKKKQSKAHKVRKGKRYIWLIQENAFTVFQVSHHCVLAPWLPHYFKLLENIEGR